MNYSLLHIDATSVIQKQVSQSSVANSDKLRNKNPKNAENNYQTLSNFSAAQALQDVAEFEGIIYGVEDGKLVKYDSESDQMVRVDLQEEDLDEKIVSLKGGHGLLLVLSSTGRIYGRRADERSFGTPKFVQVKLVPKHAKCEHGSKCRQDRPIWPKQLDFTQTSVFVVDQLGRVWSFRRDAQMFGSEAKISAEVGQVPFGAGRTVRSVCCGRGHCIALVDPHNRDDNFKPTDQQVQQQNSCTCECEKCLEEDNLRLSVLMKCADEIAEEGDRNQREEAKYSQNIETSTSSPSPSSSTPKSTATRSGADPTNQGISHKLGGKLDSLRSWNFRGTPSPATPNMKSSKSGQKSMRKEILHKPSCSSPLFSSKSNSLKAKLRLQKPNVHKQNSLDIELSTMKRSGGRGRTGRCLQQQQQFSTDLTGSIQFSFVSLDNVLASSSDDSASTLASDTDFLLSPCKSPDVSSVQERSSFSTSSSTSPRHNSNNTPCFSTSADLTRPVEPTTQNPEPISLHTKGFTELWSWGDNQCGQLGQSDTVNRKEPQKVRLLAGGPILKVCCGHNHTIVLMTTGEAYCFGSNANGQFKQINYQYFSQPTALRLGSECSIVDVGAAGDTTSVVVMSSGTPPNNTAFHFSKRHSPAEDSPTTQLQPSALPVSIQPLGEGNTLLLGWLQSTDLVTTVLFKATQACKTAVTLLGLLDRILEQNKAPKADKEKVGLSLLKYLNSALLRWAMVLSNLAQGLRQAMLKGHHLKVGNSTGSSSKKNRERVTEQQQENEVISAMIHLHFCLVDVVAHGSFYDLDIGPDLESYVERLSLDYEAESSKIYRRLNNLFHLPFKNFHQIRHIVAQQSNLPANYWKVFEHVLEKNDSIASKTCSFFHQSLSNGGFDKSLRAPHRLLLWSTEHNLASAAGNPGTSQAVKIRCDVSNGNKSSSSAIRNLLGRGWLALIVFTDSIALIQKHDYIVMDYPLVWVTAPTGGPEGKPPSAEGNDHMDADSGGAPEVFSARIVAPEYEFHIEFPNFQMKRDFLESICLMKKHKLARDYNSLEPLGSEHIALSSSRHSQHTFSTAHPTYKGATYQGSWRAGLPHGSGTLHFPSGKQYYGKFHEGLIQGLGTMKLPLESITPSPLISSVFFTSTESAAPAASGVEESAQEGGSPTSHSAREWNVYKGQWKNGKLHGLASIDWANGDTFEGYCQAGQPHGHGVLRSIQPQIGQVVYVGAWENGVKHGYGVQSTNRERYLGIWFDDQKHGKGCLISIDGTYHEGIWERNRFVRGTVVYEQQLEGEHSFGGMANQGSRAPPASFEGEFEKIGVANGKGVLQLTPFDKITGAMYGNILSGELRITNAIYTRTNLNRNAFGAEIHVVEKEPVENQWAVPAEVKWVELFAHFLVDDLDDEAGGTCEPTSLPTVKKGEEGETWASLEADQQAEEASRRAWNRIVSTLAKLKLQKGLTVDDRLERIPSNQLLWSSSYYATVAEFWHLCINTQHHPLNRLVRGVVEVFCQSYNNIGTHSVMYDAAILELHSLIRRTYEVVRRLFPKLPPSEQMYSAVPNSLGGTFSSCTTTANNRCSSTSTEDTLSLNSLVNLTNLVVTETTAGEQASTTSGSSGCLEEEGPTTSKAGHIEQRELSVGEENRDDFQVATPCCDFVIHHLFSQCYAELFIMYSVRCEEMDKRYWERVVYLNAYTDARLLKYLDVNSELWPTDSENTKALDTFTVRVTARRKFYESAIHTFQRLSGVFNPINKLAILAETFSEISACVSQFSSIGKKHVWTGDELLPAFIYVVVRAQLQHLGAEIRLISDFCPQLVGAGQIELMFTNLRAAYVQICTDKCNP